MTKEQLEQLDALAHINNPEEWYDIFYTAHQLIVGGDNAPSDFKALLIANGFESAALWFLDDPSAPFVSGRNDKGEFFATIEDITKTATSPALALLRVRIAIELAKLAERDGIEPSTQGVPTV